jgi:L-alanine-DL-glutamate epimerase-like enolase superfamily enzyme
VKFDLHLKSIRVHVYRAPTERPVQTSFGVMLNRPMIAIEATDHDGTTGWGEVWCNFPSCGAEHRAHLIDQAIGAAATSQAFPSPNHLFDFLTERFAVLAIQAGEVGPIAQAIAGIDIAVWDLVARRAHQPLWRVLGGTSGTVKVYASGLNPTAPEQLAKARQDEGFTAFKVKIGFGMDLDLRNLDALRGVLGDDVQLMADANQAWSEAEAGAAVPLLEPYRLSWLEEPLRADQPWSTWQRVKSRTSIPLAAGENICGIDAFEDAIRAGALSVLQPDIAKWGGISACIKVAHAIRASGARYCPHYLGGGIGLVASAHLLAAIGGDGMLEIDANPNPLRSFIGGPIADIGAGHITLDQEPGLGIIPDLGAIDRFRVSY